MQNKNFVKEIAGIKGEYDFFSLPSEITQDHPVIARLREFVRTRNASILDAIRALGIPLVHQYKTNILPLTGRSVLARLLAGDITYSGEVDWGALGSGSTAFTNASTQLNTEVYRKQAASQAFDDNIAYIDWFIEAGDVANQTFQEFGAFIDGSGSANSGQAWSLLITGGWVKSGSMFISGKYTINQGA